jgi:hypothetical protein
VNGVAVKGDVHVGRAHTGRGDDSVEGEGEGFGRGGGAARGGRSADVPEVMSTQKGGSGEEGRLIPLRKVVVSPGGRSRGTYVNREAHGGSLGAMVGVGVDGRGAETSPSGKSISPYRRKKPPKILVGDDGAPGEEGVDGHLAGTEGGVSPSLNDCTDSPKEVEDGVEGDSSKDGKRGSFVGGIIRKMSFGKGVCTRFRV